jgi:hypothetical protein
MMLLNNAEDPTEFAVKRHHVFYDVEVSISDLRCGEFSPRAAPGFLAWS